MKSGNPERRLSGLRNLSVFGRAVTNVLQNLRSTEPEFDNWYSKYVEEMKNDPLLKHFYDLRTKILKEGDMPTSVTTKIGHFNSNEIQNYIRPPGAKSFFIGDQKGGSGWIIELPDGTTEKYYVKLQNDTIDISIHFQNQIESHLGKKLSNKTIEDLGQMYYDYLKKLVDYAKTKFLP